MSSTYLSHSVGFVCVLITSFSNHSMNRFARMGDREDPMAASSVCWYNPPSYVMYEDKDIKQTYMYRLCEPFSNVHRLHWIPKFFWRWFARAQTVDIRHFICLFF